MKKMTNKIKYFDPPSGWKYGFPVEVQENTNYEALLREHGYPEQDIQWALENSRFWYKE